MTLKELNRHFTLRERLSRAKEMLASLQAAACPGAQVLTGMPHAPGVSDKVGDLAVEIADLEGRIQILMNELSMEERKINLFISNIENDQTRMIFRLRFLRCLTWGEVAAIIGGNNSESAVKNICYRYLESCDEPGAVVLDDAASNEL